jgi:hypothetical protein
MGSALLRVLAIIVLCTTTVAATTSFSMGDPRDAGHKPGDRGN